MKSPFAIISELAQHDVKWTGGFWKKRFDIIFESVIPNIYRLFNDKKITHCIENFKICAGDSTGTHEGPAFQDGDFFKWLEGASYVLGETKDPGLKNIIDNSIDLIRRSMRDDGYIFTKQIIKEINGENKKSDALSDSLNFEVYNLGHLITAGCVHYRSTGETSLLELAERAANYLSNVFSEDADGTAKTAICPSHYMGLIELYRVTGKRIYFETAKKAMELRDKVIDGTDDNQDRVPFLEQSEVMGHAVRATYLYAGVTDLFLENGSQELLSKLLELHTNLVTKKIYINGGCGALYDGVSPSGYAGDHPALQRTHQSFGRPYELPNTTAYNETCATVGNIFWNWRMFQATANPAYADIIETSMYNLILASISLDGLKYFYSNMLRREPSLPFFLKWARTREPYLSSFCCPPNVMRLVAESATYAYATGEDSVYIGMYGNNKASISIEGKKPFVLSQETDYPYDGQIKIQYQGPQQEMTLNIRIPSWVSSGTITTDGREIIINKSHANTFIPIKSNMLDGYTVYVNFDLSVRFCMANPYLEETINQVAVMRGPILYCMEECDQIQDCATSVGISSNTKFTINQIDICGEKLPSLFSEDGRRMKKQITISSPIYSEIEDLNTDRSRIVLVPYFAWDNRKFGQMKVWLPLYI